MKNLKKIWPFLVLAVVIRLVLMPITLHSDLWAVSFAQYFFAFKGILNIYDFLAHLPADSLLAQNYGTNFFTYPPLAYFSLGIFGFILRPFFDASFWGNLAAFLPQVLTNSQLPRHLFLTKLPYLFFDLGVLALLLTLFEESKKKQLAALLWLFNPLAFYTSYMIGQFDIIPVFFSVLALYFVKKQKPFWAAFSLGIGGAFKMFPHFFLPFLAVNQDGLSRRIKLLLFGFLPYFLSLLPFLGSAYFRQTVLFSSQSQKMFFAKVPVSGAESLSLFLVIYIFVFGLALIKKVELWKWFLAVLLLFFAVTHYHPQWFLWITPFLVIFTTEYPQFASLSAVLYCCWLVITLLFEPSLSISLFAPIFPELKNALPLSLLFGAQMDIFQFKSLVRSCFAGISLLVGWITFAKLQKREKLI